MAADHDAADAGFLPWQTDLARQWLAGRERFAHAWLIHGNTGIGKVRFARAAAASLLCESPREHLACGACPACHWVQAGNHPDLRLLRPDAVAAEEGAALEADEAAAPTGAAKKAPSRELRVEQIRSIETWVNTATHRGGSRVVVLYPAEALNLIAANALLKVLEEPPTGTIFLLVTDAPDRLLPTLVSRCRRLPLPMPQAPVAAAWLAEVGVPDAAAYLAAAGGAPLAALRAHETGAPACPAWLERWFDGLARGRAAATAGALVDELEKVPPSTWIDALQRGLADLMLVQAGGAVRYYPKLAGMLGQLAGRLPPVAVAEAARWLTGQQRIAGHPLNPRLFIHSVLLRLAALGNR